MHSPCYRPHPDAAGLAVFIHGFMGSPRQLDDLAQTAYDAGYSTLSVLLPGHGLSTRDFSRATGAQWLSHVRGEIDRHRPADSHLYLIGHSMGGLLALAVADKADGVLLIACPLKLRGLSLQSLKVRLMQVFLPKSHPMKAAYLAGSGVPPSPSLLWHSIRPTAALKRLMADIPGLLPDVTAPVTAVCSRADELVAIDSLDMLAGGLSRGFIEAVILTRSLHAYYPEPERQRIQDALSCMLGQG